MSKRIITISREFGAGGRSVGRKVAERLGYTFYDKELVKQVAEKSGLHEDFITQRGEYASTKSKLSYAFAALGAQNVINGMSMEDYVWSVQRKVILEIAEHEKCVIVGRCADYILKDRDDVLNVFLCASMEARSRRIIELYGLSEKSPAKRLEETDQKRALYYKHYTDEEWGLGKNYDMVLNTSTIGIDKCADFIVDVAKR